jgi:hypothetical protein
MASHHISLKADTELLYAALKRDDCLDSLSSVVQDAIRALAYHYGYTVKAAEVVRTVPAARDEGARAHPDPLF